MFCAHCGAQLHNEARFCSRCGTEVVRDTQYREQYAYEYSPQYHAYGGQELVCKVVERMKINGCIWIIIGVMQILGGLFKDWVLLVIGVINIISAVVELKRASDFSKRPIGIVSYAKPLFGCIVTLIYNLIFGGVIGVAGSIYYLVAVRGLVMENKDAFLEIENETIRRMQREIYE